MATLTLRAVFPSGNSGVFEIEETTLDHPLYAGQSQNGLVCAYGRLHAVKNGSTWYGQRPHRPSWSVRITDLKTLSELENVPFAAA